MYIMPESATQKNLSENTPSNTMILIMRIFAKVIFMTMKAVRKLYRRQFIALLSPTALMTACEQQFSLAVTVIRLVGAVENIEVVQKNCLILKLRNLLNFIWVQAIFCIFRMICSRPLKSGTGDEPVTDLFALQKYNMKTSAKIKQMQLSDLFISVIIQGTVMICLNKLTLP